MSKWSQKSVMCSLLLKIWYAERLYWENFRLVFPKQLRWSVIRYMNAQKINPGWVNFKIENKQWEIIPVIRASLPLEMPGNTPEKTPNFMNELLQKIRKITLLNLNCACLSLYKMCVCLLIPRWETRNEEFEHEEFLARKTDKKNEKMRVQKSCILEAFGGGNDRKFKIIFLYSQVNLKMVFKKQNLAYLEENFLNLENLVKNCQRRMR